MLGALVSAGYRSAIDHRLHGVPEGAADIARKGVANAVEASGGTGSHTQEIVHAAKQSFVDGWQQAMWAGVAVMGALFVYIALRGPKNPAPVAVGEAEAEAIAAGWWRRKANRLAQRGLLGPWQGGGQCPPPCPDSAALTLTNEHQLLHGKGSSVPFRRVVPNLRVGLGEWHD